MRVTVVVLLLTLAASLASAAPAVWLEHSDVPEALMVSNDSGAEVKNCIVEWKVVLADGRHFTEIGMVDLPANGEVKVSDCVDWWDERTSKTLDVSLKLISDGDTLAEKAYEGIFKVQPRIGLPTDRWKAVAVAGDPKKAFDGDTGTRWDTGRKQAAGDWFTLNLGAVEDVAGVVLDARQSGNDIPEGVTVEVSVRGGDWKTIVDLESTKDINRRGRIRLTFDAVEAQHIRITLTKPHGDHWFWSIHELSVLPAE
ncbi:MAG TPA: discoidin domain-containing protein [Armatimonadota bacterium]|nr:discoidin domain-containing protein [Armatimonadota bacterium]